MRVGKFQEGFLDRARSIYDLSEQSNVGRLQIWKESLAYSTHHIFGVGYGNFIVSLAGDAPSYTPYEQLGQVKNDRYNLPQKFVTAHSLYLHLLVELGALGLIAFLLWVGKFLYDWARFLWKHRGDHNELIMMVFVTTLYLLWILAQGVFDLTLFNDKILLYSFSVFGLAQVISRHYSRIKDQ